MKVTGMFFSVIYVVASKKHDGRHQPKPPPPPPHTHTQ